MLQEIWRSLKPKHQKLLRYLAELVHSETERQVEHYVAKEMNFNQFNKSLRQLKALDLVVVKSPAGGPDTIELHPLLREFVRRRFSQSERRPYISAIIVFLDQFIVAIRDSLTGGVSFDDLQNWTTKVELLINQGEYREAAIVLHEVKTALLRSGYSEEFVRLCIALFTHYESREASGTDQLKHDDLVHDLTSVLAQLGRFEEAELYIGRFEQTCAGATARSVLVCQMRTYLNWTRGNLGLAKEWGRRGVEIKTTGNLDTRYDCGHELALAQRDSGEVDSALEFFRHGVELVDIVHPDRIDESHGGAFYGNVGRCLFFIGDESGAEVCLVKAAALLEKGTDQLMLLNQGWAAEWLGELFERSKPDLAYICFRRSELKWRTISPFRAERVAQSALRVAGALREDPTNLQDWEIDRRFLDWLSGARRFPVGHRRA